MSPRTVPALWTGLALTILGSAAVSWWTTRTAAERIEQATRMLVDKASDLERRARDMTHRWWTLAGNGKKVEKEFTTPRADGETITQWIGRHKAEVEAAETEWPPVDPPSGG